MGAVQRYLQGKRSALEKCYIAAARRNPGLAGKVSLKIKVDMQGRATASASGNTDASFKQCLVDVIQNTRFPQPKGKPAEFSQQLVFKASN